MHVGLIERLKQLNAKRNVVKDRHRKRCGLLKHHAHFGTNQRNVLLRREQVFTVQNHFAFSTLLRIKLIHAVKNAQQRGFATTGRSDESSDLFLWNFKIDVLERVKLTVIKVQIFN